MLSRLLKIALLLLVWSAPLSAAGRIINPDSLHRDRELLIDEPSDSLPDSRNQRLYDSIRTKAERHTFSRLIYHWLTVQKPEEPIATGKVITPEELYGRFEGRTIRSIKIVRMEPFDSLGVLKRAANKVHLLSRERTIRRDLIIREGEKVDPRELVHNLQWLKKRSYIADARFILHTVPGDTLRVDLEVVTRDKWSISVDAYLKSGGKTMVGLSDDNFLGFGNRLAVITYFNRKNASYGGNEVDFHVPNLGGSFYEFDLQMGREFDLTSLLIKIERPFIRPNDYLLGSSYTREKERYTSLQTQEEELYQSRIFEIHGGISRRISAIGSNLFLLGQYTHLRFGTRPNVGPRYNPAFHKRDLLLASLGLYREKFIITNMLFGYGTREYLPSGYRAEITGGYSWGEFYNDYYLGASLRGGNYTPIGYLYGGAEFGSFIDSRGKQWYRSSLDLDLKWFSNLLPARDCHLRQFVEFNYTQGWRRLLGYDESISYTDLNGIRMMEEDADGFTRTALNCETVLFTPLQPWGFGLTFYGFFDIGTLGYRDNPFKNPVYSSFGFGVRIKNERLVFGAIQLQFGVALGKGGLLDSRWFEVSSQSSYQRFEIRPTHPEFAFYE